jgi:alpha-1,3-rhamnosyltransferase
LKFIAGDDALLVDCIKWNIAYVGKRESIKILQTKVNVYNKGFEENNFMYSEPSKKRIHNFQLTSSEQYKVLIKNNFVKAPSIFIHRETLIEIGGFDEYLTLMEDLPLWINATKLGYKIYFYDILSVKYRVHNDSVTKLSKPYMSGRFAKELLKFKSKYVKHNVNLLEIIRYTIKLKSFIVFENLGFNNNSRLSKKLYHIINRI